MTRPELCGTDNFVTPEGGKRKFLEIYSGEQRNSFESGGRQKKERGRISTRAEGGRRKAEVNNCGRRKVEFRPALDRALFCRTRDRDSCKNGTSAG